MLALFPPKGRRDAQPSTAKGEQGWQGVRQLALPQPLPHPSLRAYGTESKAGEALMGHSKGLA